MGRCNGSWKRRVCLAWCVGAVWAGCGARAWGQSAEAPADHGAGGAESIRESSGGSSGGSAPASSADDLTSLSLEALMNMQVTSVSKQKQRLADAPAAVYVITSDDIQRSGMSTIGDLLRLSPGLDVAQINSNTFAISARGFNDQSANKLLVLMDGRVLYRPLYSGTNWNVLDTVLQDLDRIEVVRGPGATLWGSNAVNGVINITSKDASQTQGWLLSGRGGTEDGGASVRYGGKLDEQTYYRAYGAYRLQDSSVFASGGHADDEHEMQQGGFRIDRFATDSDTYTVQGNLFDVRNGTNQVAPTNTPPFLQVEGTQEDAWGGHLLGRWTHVISERSDFTLQLYYDRFDALYLQDSVDVDFQHRFALGDRQEIIWGAGYRYMHDNQEPTPIVRLDPSTRADYLASAFIQDRLTLSPQTLYLFGGSKFEINSYTGLEVQPSLRLLWTPDHRNSIWGAVSRAVRTPSRIEEDGRVIFDQGVQEVAPGVNVPYTVEFSGRTSFKSEELLAWEAGYRSQLTDTLSLDVAGFYNQYTNLRSLELGAAMPVAGPPPHIIIPMTARNSIDANTWGAEASLTAEITDDWRLSASYTFFHMDLDLNGLTNDTASEDLYGGSHPSHQFQVRSYWNIGRDLQLNVLGFYVDNLPRGDVPSYVRLDANLLWRLSKGLDLQIGVQNALDDRHPEFPQIVAFPTEIQRAFYAQLTWSF